MNRLLLVALVVAVAAPCPANDSRPRKYPLAKPPLEIFAGLAELKLGDVPPLRDAERQLLVRVWDWRTKQGAGNAPALDEDLLLDAMLFASGVEDDAARKKYRDQFEALAAEARAATGSATSDRERGEALMRLLHAGVMSKGYAEDQTTLSAVLDSGKYNCVSSTALYCLVGSKLNLQLQPISIPGSPHLAGHAALDLVDGQQRIQVEPTNPDGFDWATKVKRPGVLIIGYVPDRKKGHEVDLLGIAASIYSNRGVGLDKAERPDRLASARCYLAALALDPLDGTASNNLQAVFTNWGPALVAEQRFEDAIKVLAFGQAIAPEARELRKNMTHAWSKYIEATMAAGDHAQALAHIRRAAAAAPEDHAFRSPADWFKRHAETLREAGGWEAALAAAEPGFKLLASDEANKLRRWRSGLYRRWSQALLDAKEIKQSLQVLARAYAIDAGDRDIHDGLGYHAQQALKLLDAGGDDAAAIEHFQALRAQFPQVKDIAEAGWSHALEAVDALAEAGKFAEAIKAAERFQPLVVDAKQQPELGARPYCRWSEQLAKEKKWLEALDKYAAGLKVWPKERHLVNGAAATVDQWASEAIAVKNWDEAIRIYDRGLTDYVPDHAGLKQNRRYCESMKKEK